MRNKYTHVIKEYQQTIPPTPQELYNTNKVARTIKKKLIPSPQVTLRNKSQSICYKQISPGCIDCQRRTGRTISLSLDCNLDCFFCFYPGPIKNHKNDWAKIIKDILLNKDRLYSFAISGGEPLLHSETTYKLFDLVNQLTNGKSQLRLYTNGTLLNTTILKKLQALGLQEIRISLKNYTVPQKLIRSVKKYIPRVMIEVPVFPDQNQALKKMLIDLDACGIYGVNLLEAVYSFRNTAEYVARKYKIKRTLVTSASLTPPQKKKISPLPLIQSGIPILGSEQVALELLQFANAQKLNLGVHYCSAYNKRYSNPAQIRAWLKKNIHRDPAKYPNT